MTRAQPETEVPQDRGDASGTTLGPYAVTAKIGGEGGIGPIRQGSPGQATGSVIDSLVVNSRTNLFC